MDLASEEFAVRLAEEEKSASTIEKYLRDVTAFFLWLGKKPLAKETVLLWKAELLRRGYAAVTVNAKLAALNRYLLFAGRTDCRVRPLRIQRRVFRRSERELSQREYRELIDAARSQGMERTALIMETICATGIRVSELRYITVEAAKRGESSVALKGKIRMILLPRKLCAKLLKYAKQKNITAGEIFLSPSGESLSRKRIWSDMKAVCRLTGIAPSKVFPHNLRHLFAVTYYNMCHDVAKLADVLGHSSIETTRIYLISTGREHALYLEQMKLVV